MSEAVELDRAHFRSFRQARIFPLSEVVDLQGLPQRLAALPQIVPFLRENKPEIVVTGSVRKLQLCLMALVSAKQLDGLGSDGYSARFACLRGSERGFGSRCQKLLNDAYFARIEIEISPVQSA